MQLAMTVPRACIVVSSMSACFRTFWPGVSNEYQALSSRLRITLRELTDLVHVVIDAGCDSGHTSP